MRVPIFCSFEDKLPAFQFFFLPSNHWVLPLKVILDILCPIISFKRREKLGSERQSEFPKFTFLGKAKLEFESQCYQVPYILWSALDLGWWHDNFPSNFQSWVIVPCLKHVMCVFYEIIIRLYGKLLKDYFANKRLENYILDSLDWRQYL